MGGRPVPKTQICSDLTSVDKYEMKTKKATVEGHTLVSFTAIGSYIDVQRFSR